MAPFTSFRTLQAAGNAGGGAFEYTISSNSQEINLATVATANGWDGSAEATITIGQGVYVWSDSVSTPALTTGTFPGGLTIVNEGYIMGKGGAGGQGGTPNQSTMNAGPAIKITSSGVSIDNTSTSAYIGGGGGGGGSFDYAGDSTGAGGGGGAGGGAGGDYKGYDNLPSSNGGSAGGVGQYGGNGVYNNTAIRFGSGGGGGRIMPGSQAPAGSTSTTTPPGGSGGGAGGYGYCCAGTTGYVGGYGSGSGNAGGPGNTGPSSSAGAGGGGGGYGADGGVSGGGTNGQTGVAGGEGGKAVDLNGNSITWVGGFPTGYVFGSVS